MTGEDAAVAERHVAGDQGVVDDGAVVSHVDIVAQVAADHEHVAVADPGHAIALGGASVDGHEFTEHVAFADPHRRRLALIAAVLRALSEDGPVPNVIPCAHRERAA